MLAWYLPAFRDVGRRFVEELGKSPSAYRFLEYLGEIAAQIHSRLEIQAVLES
jgi:hypothetical protein